MEKVWAELLKVQNLAEGEKPQMSVVFHPPLTELSLLKDRKNKNKPKTKKHKRALW